MKRVIEIREVGLAKAQELCEKGWHLHSVIGLSNSENAGIFYIMVWYNNQ